jgi:hypothetical protein
LNLKPQNEACPAVIAVAVVTEPVETSLSKGISNNEIKNHCLFFTIRHSSLLYKLIATAHYSFNDEMVVVQLKIVFIFAG